MIRIRSLAMTIAVLLLMSLDSVLAAGELQARQGVMDLQQWRLAATPSIELKGQWLVYPGQLLTFDELSLQPIPQSLPFPLSPLSCEKMSLRGEHGGAENSQTPCMATYVLELRHLPTQPLAIEIPELSTAFKLFWNREVIAQGGVVSDQVSDFTPYVGHRLASVQTDERRGVLILQVANLTVSKGPVRHLVLGDALTLKARYEQQELIQALAAAIAGIGGLLLMLQQRARRRYEKGLWGLALFSFATLIYTITEGYTVITWLTDAITWSDVMRLNIVSQNLFLPGLVFWLTGRFTGAFSNWYLNLARIQLLIVVPVLLLLPESLLIRIESPQMILNLILGLIGFVYMFRFGRGLSYSTALSGSGLTEPQAQSNDRRDIRVLMFTLLLVMLPASHDVLIYQQLLLGSDWLPLGFVAFIISQIFLLAVQRARQHAYLDRVNQQILSRQQQQEKAADGLSRELKVVTDQLDEVTQELNYLRRHDELTGLLRQSCFLTESQRLFSEQRHSTGNVSLILLDLDRYKLIGARHGPNGADQALKTVAALLSSWDERGALCARLEGESFALLIFGMDERKALEEAELLRLRISQRSVEADEEIDNTHSFQITASLGVCTFSVAEAEIRTMLDSAEMALNRAKVNGRNCVVGYSQLMTIED